MAIVVLRNCLRLVLASPQPSIALRGEANNHGAEMAKQGDDWARFRRSAGQGRGGEAGVESYPPRGESVSCRSPDLCNIATIVRLT